MSTDETDVPNGLTHLNENEKKSPKNLEVLGTRSKYHFTTQRLVNKKKLPQLVKITQNIISKASKCHKTKKIQLGNWWKTRKFRFNCHIIRWKSEETSKKCVTLLNSIQNVISQLKILHTSKNVKNDKRNFKNLNFSLLRCNMKKKIAQNVHLKTKKNPQKYEKTIQNM